MTDCPTCTPPMPKMDAGFLVAIAHKQETGHVQVGSNGPDEAHCYDDGCGWRWGQ